MATGYWSRVTRHGRMRRCLRCVTAAGTAVVLVLSAGCTGTPDAATSSSAVGSRSSVVEVADSTESLDATRQAPVVPAALLPFREPSQTSLPHVLRLSLQAVLDEKMTRADGVGIAGLTAAVVSDDGTWAGAAGADGQGRVLVAESMMGICVDHEDCGRCRADAFGRNRSGRAGCARLQILASPAPGSRTHRPATSVTHQWSRPGNDREVVCGHHSGWPWSNMDSRGGAGVRGWAILRARKPRAGLQQLQLRTAGSADRARHR